MRKDNNKTGLPKNWVRPVLGFTLVELIVVITILAILWTIAIMAFSGYSKNARDSARISDISNMKKSLELWILQSGTYPDPSSGTWVTYSWTTVWTQWNFWDSVTSTVGKLDKKPVDPLYNNEYTYSVTQSKKEYQIGAVLEKDIALNNPILPQTYAATTGEAYVSGTYNGILTTVGTTPVYIIALPSILISDITVTELKNIATSTLVYEWQSNLPSSYKVTGLTMTGTSFAFTPTVVWSGSSLTELNTQTWFQDMVSNLQSVYTNNSVFASLPEYATIVSWDTTPSITTMSFVKGLVQTNTNTELSNVSSTYVSYAVNGVCGTADGQGLGDSNSITWSAACTVWTASAISWSGPWTWTCGGSNGGTPANCNASIVVCNEWEIVENWQCKDPHWNNVVSLMHFDGTIIDEKARVWTSSPTSTGFSNSSKYGSHSIDFLATTLPTSATTNNTIHTPSSSEFNFLNSSFTVELWVYVDAINQYNALVYRRGWNDVLGSWICYINSTGKVGMWNGSTLHNTTDSIPTNQWVHLAFSRNQTSGLLKIFFNGIEKYSWAFNASTSSDSYPLYVGWYYSSLAEYLNGRIDDLRITKWVARYSTGFTVPIQAFPNQ